ncbi:MAG: hypothetical protein AB1330_10785 [Bacillota bacterium]
MVKYRLEDYQPYAVELEKLHGLEARLEAARAELERERARLAKVELEHEEQIRMDADRLLAGGEPGKGAKKLSEARRRAMEAVEDSEYTVRTIETALARQREVVETAKQQARAEVLKRVREDHQTITRKLFPLLVQVAKLFGEERRLRETAEQVLERSLVAAPIERSPLVPPPGRLDPGDPEENGPLGTYRKELEANGYAV